MCHLFHYPQPISDELVAQVEELMREGGTTTARLEQWDLMETISEIIELERLLDETESELERRERVMETARSKMVTLQSRLEEFERDTYQLKIFINSAHIAIALFVTAFVVFRSSAGRSLLVWLRDMFG